MSSLTFAGTSECETQSKFLYLLLLTHDYRNSTKT
ncbi:hypothetical protein ACROYT_G001692 [Oculina patagonica]